MFRVVLGFVAAALCFPAGVLVYAMCIGEWRWGPLFASLAAVYTVPLTILVAAPLFLLFRRHASFLVCVGAGIAVGLIGVLLEALLGSYGYAVAMAWKFAAVGAVSASVFYFVAVFRNRFVGAPQAAT